MLQKPPIATKPKVAQKTSYIIKNENQSQKVIAQSRNGKKENNEYADNQPLLPTSPKPSNEANLVSLPSSPPNYSDCTNDCCGILNHKQLDCIKRLHKNGKYSNGAREVENGSSFHHNNDNHKIADKSFKTSSQSFDSLSSSSGGFKDMEFVAKTRAAYAFYDKEDNCLPNNQPIDPEAPSPQTTIGNSKVQEMKSKLFAQQQQKQQQQNHVSNEPSAAITRQQYQKSSRELEKVLGLRIEHRQKPAASSGQEKLVKRLSKSFDDAECNVAAITSQIGANISKQIQQKLTEEMKQQCEIIKEKFLIEKIPVQQHYKDYTVQTV